MQRFNVALLPVEEKWQGVFSKIARDYFSACSDGYLLGKDAFAHVTLCQFNASDETIAQEVFSSFKDKTEEKLSITAFNSPKGFVEQTEYIWMEYLIEKTPWLLEKQRSCFEHLARKGSNSWTLPETYRPHITLARIRQMPDRLPTLNDLPETGPITFRVCVGHSTENGVFVREL